MEAAGFPTSRDRKDGERLGVTSERSPARFSSHGLCAARDRRGISLGSETVGARYMEERFLGCVSRRFAQRQNAGTPLGMTSRGDALVAPASSRRFYFAASEKQIRRQDGGATRAVSIHGFGDTRVQNSSNSRVSKKAVALIT